MRPLVCAILLCSCLLGIVLPTAQAQSGGIAYTWIPQSTTEPPRCADCGRYFEPDSDQYQAFSTPQTLQFSQLPSISYPSKPEWEALYQVAWKAFLKNVELPDGYNETSFPAPRLKTQYSKHDFQWDQAIISLSFGKYAHKSFSTVLALDNFYRFQHEDGFIPREISPDDKEIVFFPGLSMPHLQGDLNLPERQRHIKAIHERENSANPPLLAEAELQHYWLSRDRARLTQVIEALEMHTEWLEENLKIQQGNLQGLFRLGQEGSGLDNLPLGKYYFEEVVRLVGQERLSQVQEIQSQNFQFARVDTSAQMVVHYSAKAEIERLLDHKKRQKQYKKKAKTLTQKINKCMWHQGVQFYFDVRNDCVDSGEMPDGRFQKLTLASFWTLYAGIADKSKAEAMTRYLESDDHFATPLPYPALSHTDPDFSKDGDAFSGDWGDYWRGGVWPPLMYMVLKGLQNYPKVNAIWDEVNRASQLYIRGLAEVMFEGEEYDENQIDAYKQRIYEYNSPLGGVGKRGPQGERIDAKQMFVGWGGAGPIALMQEVVIGIHVEEKRIVWNLYDTHEDMGISNLKVGNSTFSLHYTANLSNMRPTAEDFDIKVSDASGSDLKTLVVRFEGESNQLETLTISLAE